MAEITEITYRPRPDGPMDLNPARGFAMFGAYRVRYDDDFTVLIPHSGYVGTVSAYPLDPDIDEHRQIIVQSAERIRADLRDSQAHPGSANSRGGDITTHGECPCAAPRSSQPSSP